MIENVNPIQLGVKFKPPTIAMLYTNSGENFVHEFPIGYGDLEKRTDAIYREVLTLHPGYLDMVEPKQVKALIEKIKTHHKEEQFEELNKKVAGLDLDLDSDEDDLDIVFKGDQDINYDDLELDMEGDLSDEDIII
jgi:hypothetical protein